LTYHQVTEEERYQIAALRQAGWWPAEIGRRLGRHRSTISRELARNGSPWDGGYRPSKAQERANGRRSRSRRNRRFEGAAWRIVERLLRFDWSPEQIAGRLARHGELSISHETIYRYVWADRAAGGDLHRHLRCATRKRRKRYGHYDSRGRLAGKRAIGERPRAVEHRQAVGHWEIDTVMGQGKDHCIVTLVERATGYVLIGKLRSRNARELNRRTVALIRGSRREFKTITADNGTEFRSYREIEQATGVKFYFATPHHAWERGSNENANGLVRQYLPKRKSMARIDQRTCNRIAKKLNSRPRKRYEFETPEERFHAVSQMVHFKCEAKQRLTTPKHSLFHFLCSTYSLRATALLNRDSREAKTKVTRPARTRSRMGCSVSSRMRSSLKYRRLNSAHLSGSWLNQRRSSADGAASLGHRSILASSFERPRGQSRSTRMRQPSERDGASYARFSEMGIASRAAAQRIGVQRRPTAPLRPLRAPEVDARRLPNHNWNALLDVRCNALLDRAPPLGKRSWKWAGKIASPWTPR